MLRLQAIDLMTNFPRRPARNRTGRQASDNAPKGGDVGLSGLVLPRRIRCGHHCDGLAPDASRHRLAPGACSHVTRAAGRRSSCSRRPVSLFTGSRRLSARLGGGLTVVNHCWVARLPQVDRNKCQGDRLDPRRRRFGSHSRLHAAGSRSGRQPGWCRSRNAARSASQGTAGCAGPRKRRVALANCRCHPGQSRSSNCGKRAASGAVGLSTRRSCVTVGGSCVEPGSSQTAGRRQAE